MDQLPHALFPLAGVHFAVEILVGDDVGGQLAPGGGDFAIALLEDDLAPFALDGGGPQFPVDGVEGIGDVGGAEGPLDQQRHRRRPDRFRPIRDRRTAGRVGLPASCPPALRSPRFGCSGVG